MKGRYHFPIRHFLIANVNKCQVAKGILAFLFAGIEDSNPQKVYVYAENSVGWL